MPTTRSDLMTLLAVIDEGSLTGAADHLGLSVSTVSGRLSELEQKAGVDLLVRRRGGIRLTNAGSDLVARAEEILERFDALEDALRMHARARSQQIRILTNTSAVDVLTEFLAATLAQFPKLRVQLEEVPSREASRRLAEGEVDLAIVSLPPREEGLEVRPLWLDPLVAVNARDDEAPVDAQTFATIVRGPMIGLPVASPLQRFIERQARDIGIELDYRVRLPTVDAVLALASTGVGAAIVPRAAVRDRDAGGIIVHTLPDAWAQRRALLLTRSGWAPQAASVQFIDALLRFGADTADELLNAKHDGG